MNRDTLRARLTDDTLQRATAVANPVFAVSARNYDAMRTVLLDALCPPTPDASEPDPLELSKAQLAAIETWAADTRPLWGNDEARRINLTTFARLIVGHYRRYPTPVGILAKERAGMRTTLEPPSAPSGHQFRKKPVVITAIRWMNDRDGDSLKLILALAGNGRVTFAADGTADLVIETLEGNMRANVGDWIIRGVKGEIYPCKPEIFVATYEPVTTPEPPSAPCLTVEALTLEVADLFDVIGWTVRGGRLRSAAKAAQESRQ